jgi:ADP-heptose:LPS heptosyltransferase
MPQAQLSRYYAQTRAAEKIVVVDLAFLGDTVHLIPALWEIKRHYPQAALHVLTSPVGAEVLQLAPCADHVWPLEIHPDKRTWREHWQVIRALQREKFDVAFNFNGTDRTTILTGLTGARCRIAHAAGRTHFWNRWLVANWVPKQDPDLPVFEQRRQVLSACGLALESPRWDLKVPGEARRWAEQTVPEGAVHVSINSNNPLKEWPLSNHAALLKALWAERPALRVVASASAKERERERLRELATIVDDARLQLLPANLTIAQLAAVLARCKLHVGPDSGVMHLAVALEVPTISFFREQGAYKSWLPIGAAHRVITMPCGCIDHHAAPCEKLGRAECLARIEPEHVAELIHKLLDSLNGFPEPTAPRV